MTTTKTTTITPKALVSSTTDSIDSIDSVLLSCTIGNGDDDIRRNNIAKQIKSTNKKTSFIPTTTLKKSENDFSSNSCSYCHSINKSLTITTLKKMSSIIENHNTSTNINNSSIVSSNNNNKVKDEEDKDSVVESSTSSSSSDDDEEDSLVAPSHHKLRQHKKCIIKKYRDHNQLDQMDVNGSFDNENEDDNTSDLTSSPPPPEVLTSSSGSSSSCYSSPAISPPSSYSSLNPQNLRSLLNLTPVSNNKENNNMKEKKFKKQQFCSSKNNENINPVPLPPPPPPSSYLYYHQKCQIESEFTCCPLCCPHYHDPDHHQFSSSFPSSPIPTSHLLPYYPPTVSSIRDAVSHLTRLDDFNVVKLSHGFFSQVFKVG